MLMSAQYKSQNSVEHPVEGFAFSGLGVGALGGWADLSNLRRYLSVAAVNIVFCAQNMHE
jgi:hypothetical protein